MLDLKLPNLGVCRSSKIHNLRTADYKILSPHFLVDWHIYRLDACPCHPYIEVESTDSLTLL